MKISLVTTGGTIESRVEDGMISISNAATEQIASIIDADSIFGEYKIHSASIELADLNSLKIVITRALQTAPDGVIVTHGTDTLAFSAAYLAYAFSKTNIPIVLCAADRPLTDADSNGYAVLNAAKSFIASRRAGVYVIYKNPGDTVRLHHGARLVPAHMHEDFYFSIGDGNAFADTGLMHGMDFNLADGRRVLCISPYVGLDYSAFDMAGCSAVVQVAYHSGRVNTEKFNEFANAHADIPMFLTAGRKKYGVKELAQNVTRCYGITQTALYIKILVGLRNRVKDLPAFVLKDACGEIVK